MAIRRSILLGWFVRPWAHVRFGSKVDTPKLATFSTPVSLVVKMMKVSCELLVFLRKTQPKLFGIFPTLTQYSMNFQSGKYRVPIVKDNIVRGSFYKSFLD